MSAKANRKLAETKADELLALMFPGAPVAKAGKQIAWIPRGDTRIPISNAEDLFGCFDRIVATGTRVLAIQATMLDAGETAASHRRTKVRKAFVEPLVATLGEAGCDLDYVARTVGASWSLEVWAWEKRRAMHVWRWSWALAQWIREPSVWAIKKGELVAIAREAA